MNKLNLWIGRQLKFWFGGTQVVYTLIWGYAVGFESDLGVRKYQKVENPCSIACRIKSQISKMFFKSDNECTSLYYVRKISHTKVQLKLDWTFKNKNKLNLMHSRQFFWTFETLIKDLGLIKFQFHQHFGKCLFNNYFCQKVEFQTISIKWFLKPSTAVLKSFNTDSYMYSFLKIFNKMLNGVRLMEDAAFKSLHTGQETKVLNQSFNKVLR
jgi:hypothetical protein